MDSRIRWKVKRRIRDAQIALATVLLLASWSPVSSGKATRCTVHPLRAKEPGAARGGDPGKTFLKSLTKFEKLCFDDFLHPVLEENSFRNYCRIV